MVVDVEARVIVSVVLKLTNSLYGITFLGLNLE
jgi:hypothetical protein